jgi:hypothetical protein
VLNARAAACVVPQCSRLPTPRSQTPPLIDIDSDGQADALGAHANTRSSRNSHTFDLVLNSFLKNTLENWQDDLNQILILYLRIPSSISAQICCYYGPSLKINSLNLLLPLASAISILRLSSNIQFVTLSSRCIYRLRLV